MKTLLIPVSRCVCTWHGIRGVVDIFVGMGDTDIRICEAKNLIN